MIRLLDCNAGPTLVVGDCLAAVLTLHRADDGHVCGLCPFCGERAVDTVSPDGGPVHAQLFQGIAYLQGPGVLVPCGHYIGAIDMEVLSS